MMATSKKLEEEAEKLSQDDASASKKKRAREARKLASRVKAALAEGRIEEEIKGVKLEKVFSRESTKQAMIARVCIHFQVISATRFMNPSLASAHPGITSQSFKLGPLRYKEQLSDSLP